MVSLFRSDCRTLGKQWTLGEKEMRVETFLKELKELEKKHQFEIDHHGEFVSYLCDTSISNNRCAPIGYLSNDSDFEEFKK